MITSVIIPAHNEQEYIGDTLRSYQQQHFGTKKTPYKLIVVANGCDPSDDTASIAHDLGAKVIELTPENVSGARNSGAHKAEGDLLIFNDADTRVAPNYVDCIAATIEEGYDMGCALFKPENYHPVTLLYSLLTWGSGFVMGDAGGNMYVRRSAFDQSKGFNVDLKIGEDTDLSRRLQKTGARYKFLHSTHIITSMRKFQKHGYFNELLVRQLWPYMKQTFLPRNDHR